MIVWEATHLGFILISGSPLEAEVDMSDASHARVFRRDLPVSLPE